jgi:hypothetical protein
MRQVQGGRSKASKGEAVVVYREPFTTQEMRYHQLSRRVNDMAVFPTFLDISRSELDNVAQNDRKNGLLLLLRTFSHVVYAILG